MGGMIVIWTLKGGQGKSSLALALAYELGYPVAVNETYSTLPRLLGDDNCMVIPPSTRALPRLPDNCIIDLGGYADGRAIELIQRCDKLIIPVSFGGALDMQMGIESIDEARNYKDDAAIAVVINNVAKSKQDEAKQILDSLFNDLNYFDVKPSTALSRLPERREAVSKTAQAQPLLRYHYKDAVEQIDALARWAA